MQHLFTKTESALLAQWISGGRESNPGPPVSRAEAKRLYNFVNERIPKKAREKADKLYKMWSEKKPDQDIVITIEWPEDQVVLGEGVAIGYTSDKWKKKGQFQDYIHHFDRREPPQVVIENPCNNAEGYVEPWMKNLKKVKKRIPPPKHPVFTALGKALDVEFIGQGMVKQIDWKDLDEDMPWLLIDTERNLLIIQQGEGTPAVLLDSPVVEITARGIEN